LDVDITPGSQRDFLSVDLTGFIRLRQHCRQAAFVLPWVWGYLILALEAPLRFPAAAQLSVMLGIPATYAFYKGHLRTAAITGASVVLAAYLTALDSRLWHSAREYEVLAIMLGCFSLVVARALITVVKMLYRLHAEPAARQYVRMTFSKNRPAVRPPRRRMDRYTKIGIAVFIVGFSFSATVRLLINMGGQRQLRGSPAWINLATFAVGGRFLILGRRRSALTATELRAHDSRPIILVLRSFGDDQMEVKARRLRFSFADNHYYLRGVTLERVLTEHLSPYGPVVAIGEPGETLPPLGAARDQVAGESWRETVARWMREARLIVLIVSATDGLRWEFGRLCGLGLLQKTILLLPPVAQSERRSRYAGLTAPEAAAARLAPEASAEHALAILWGRDSTPVVLRARQQHEWAYQVALNIAGHLLSRTPSESLAAAQRA
jgi:hypothetical protein